MSLNVGKVKGEIFIKEKEIDSEKLKSINLKELSKNGSAPLSVVTNLSEIINVPAGFLMDDKKISRLREGCIVYENLDYKRIKARAIELGWTSINISPLFSDFVNSFRFITYGQLNRLYGYELRNLCFLLDCNLDYLFGGELKDCEVDDLIVTSNMREFKLDGDKLKQRILSYKFKIDSKEELIKNLCISEKYLTNLCENIYSYVPSIIVKKITTYFDCSEKDLEYVESLEETKENTIYSKRYDTGISINGNNFVPKRILLEENEKIKKDLDISRNTLDTTTNLVRLAVEDKESFEFNFKII